LYIGNEKVTAKKNNYKKEFHSLFNIHKQVSSILSNTNKIKKISVNLHKSKSIFFIGRGIMYPLALEGALKLKEITYKHCEGYAAGELKHGPLALIEKNIPLIALAPFDNNFDKIMSNIQEVKARGGLIILITDSIGAKKAKKYCDQIILMPRTNFLSSPILYSIPIQLISYFLAVKLKRDIDKPRNLAKSVTVE
jgi:glucosamine--fructose-6-phosphate aminotransferase (isomerizing)